MNQVNNPKWWTDKNDSAWDRAKAAFKRDWDQTVHDVSGRRPDTDQDVDDTVKQAMGKDPIPPRGQPTYEEKEPAYRFGYGARSFYGNKYPQWNRDVEQQLKKEWSELYPSRTNRWDADLDDIRYGWDYETR